MTSQTEKVMPMKFRAIGPIIKAAGLVPWTVMFAILFIISSIVVVIAEPGITTFRDSAWVMFQVVTTIGLGDFTCVTFLGRIFTVILSVYSVLYLALITGAVVSYCTERMRHRRDKSIAHFIDQLEHLPELSHEELVDISRKVKRLSKRVS